MLPPGDDPNDWVAVHVVDFFNRINLIYGTIVDFCTPVTCPAMSGGPKFEYLWVRCFFLNNLLVSSLW